MASYRSVSIHIKTFYIVYYSRICCVKEIRKMAVLIDTMKYGETKAELEERDNGNWAEASRKIVINSAVLFENEFWFKCRRQQLFVTLSHVHSVLRT